MLEPILIAAALVAGITGAWSPCGLSMVETLAPQGYAGRLRTSLASCLTFAAGALAGGAITFGGLSLLGAVIGPQTPVAAWVAGALALVAAVGEARGMRIVPQIRRQVPESWRRVLAVPLAAALYGVLLGLGFTTFVLSFAVWALAGVCVALGTPALGLSIGLAFGLGRAIPVIALAPAADTSWGSRIHAAMAEKPVIYRALRLADAAAMLACAALLVTAPAQADAAGVPGAPAAASQLPSLLPALVARPASDPSAGPSAVAWQVPGVGGAVRRSGREVDLPGRGPVVSASEIAWRNADSVTFAPLTTLIPSATEIASGADAFSFSADWLIWRAPRGDGGQRLLARPRGRQELKAAVLESVPPHAQLGRPSLDEDRVVYHVTSPRGSRIVMRDLITGTVEVLRQTRRALLLNPTLNGDELLHVSSSRQAQELLIGPLSGTDRPLYITTPTARRDDEHERGKLRAHTHYRFIRGRYRPVARPPRPARAPRGSTITLWTTALDPTHAYVTRLVLRGGRTSASVLRVAR